MSEKNDGGTAFPQLTRDPWGNTCSTGGLSMRDWFAGQALVGLSAIIDSASAAKTAYKYADAMLAEREKQ